MRSESFGGTWIDGFRRCVTVNGHYGVGMKASSFARIRAMEWDETEPDCTPAKSDPTPDEI